MAIKKLLQDILGQSRYLSLLARSFQTLYRTGWLGKEYQDVYFLKKIIRPGDYCIDIGAHLGYFSLELSRLTGDTGKVFAVEPMSPFHDTLQRLLQRKKARNVTLYQLALGGKGEYVEMGIPRIGNVNRFAYARVKEISAGLEFVSSERIRNESGDHLFSDLPRVDYIKCDVEGLEYEVFASMIRTIERHHPIVMCELVEREQRIRVFELFRPYGYKIYALEKDRLTPLDVYAEGAIAAQNDYLIPGGQEDRLRHLIRP